MGADLFESFVGSIVAASTLGQDKYGAAGVALPFYVAGLGAVCSIVGTMMVRVSSTADSATAAQRLSDETGQEHEVKSAGIMEKLLDSIRFAIYFSSFLIMIATILAVCMTFGPGENLSWNLFACVVIGLVCGNLIGYTTEYATSFTYPPTVSIAKKADTGAATVIIQGLGVGMLSSVPPVLFMFLTILSTYYIAGSDYGVAIAAVGMLSTLGVTLATDAFGPVADNAGGIAEMAPENEIPHDVRDRTDALDALGNTTAATGKGFAIGSAVLTALALLSAITDNATPRLETVNILAPVSLPAVLIGALMPYLFSALTMLSVGQAAESIMWECRNQLNLRFFQNKPLDATGVISISTRSSLKEMVAPGVIAIVVPIIVGLMLGTPGLISLLSGSTSSGFLLAVLMSNAGGAWDNAKKFIEKGGLGPGKGKKSPQHKAAVVGDTVGDPFKDTSGPSLNILIKLMSIVALVMAKQLDQDAWAKWWQGLIFIIVLVLFIIGYLSFGAKLMGSQLDHDAIDRQSAERKQRQAAAKGSEKKEDH
jgi:K(+)-stimulated pyrophosphate-energized sodium pump